MASSNIVDAFLPHWHVELISDAFQSVPDADTFADRHSAESAGKKIDEDTTNDDVNQYRHSMRSRSQSLQDAQRTMHDYVDQEMKLAVAAARALPARKVEAGRHLGLALHAIQDQKHNWSSCNSASNLPESKDPCSTSGSGCSAPGAGNHGLSPDCRPLYLWQSLAYFQTATDIDPTPGQWNQAVRQSITLLSEFVEKAKQ